MDWYFKIALTEHGVAKEIGLLYASEAGDSRGNKVSIGRKGRTFYYQEPRKLGLVEGNMLLECCFVERRCIVKYGFIKFGLLVEFCAEKNPLAART